MLQTGRVKIEHNPEGIRELLQSDPVAEEIERRAELVRQAAQERYDAIAVGARDKGEKPGDPVEVTVTMVEGTHRARARVAADHPAAAAIEAKHRPLGQSIDAARG